LGFSIDVANAGTVQGSDFPAAAVRDIVVHPRESDLILATHGRGIWIIDRYLPSPRPDSGTHAEDAMVLAGRPVTQLHEHQRGWPEGDESFNGQPAYDAFITYYQKSRHIFGDLKIEVFDQEASSSDTIRAANIAA